jgi:hypothetical protein
LANLDQQVKRLEIEAKGMLLAHVTLVNVADDVEAHLAWANFVRHMRMCAKLLFRVGKANGDTRGLAWRAENAITQDEILDFLTKSRNDIDHPEDEDKEHLTSGEMRPSDRVFEPVGSGMNALSKASHGLAFFHNVNINGRLVSGAEINYPNGHKSTMGNLRVVERQRGFAVRPVANHSGEFTRVPINKQNNVPYMAEEMAEYGVKWLKHQVASLLTDQQREKVQCW